MTLKNISLKELWELFPIIFVNNNNHFNDNYLEEESILKFLLNTNIKRISHIGSTAINNIKTKPIVDILIEIDFKNINIVKSILLNNGYLLMNESINKVSFNKGYTNKGYADKVFHLHIKKYGNAEELYFRDYLNDNQDKAKEYESLKLALYQEYQPNRDLYTSGKSNFVNEVVKLAKEKYKNRY